MKRRAAVLSLALLAGCPKRGTVVLPEPLPKTPKEILIAELQLCFSKHLEWLSKLDERFIVPNGPAGMAGTVSGQLMLMLVHQGLSAVAEYNGTGFEPDPSAQPSVNLEEWFPEWQLDQGEFRRWKASTATPSMGNAVVTVDLYSMGK